MAIMSVPFFNLFGSGNAPNMPPTSPIPNQTTWASQFTGSSNIMGATSYFTTNQVGSRNGWWNLSSGGGAGHSRISWMRQHFGMKWTEFRKILADIFVDTRRDANILDKIRARIAPFVPVRSGRLLDTIYRTLMITRIKWINAHHWHNVSFDWSVKRPFPILGKVNHVFPPDTGAGELYTPTYPIHNRQVIAPGFYELNDPNAMNNPVDTIKTIALEELQDDILTVIDSTIITYFIPSISMPLAPTLP